MTLAIEMMDAKYYERFLKRKFDNFVATAQIIKTYKRKFGEVPHYLDIEPFLRIRNEIVSQVCAEQLVRAAKRTNNIYNVIERFFNFLYKNRARMAGCCATCHMDIFSLDEYCFMLKDEVWTNAAKSFDNSFLCVGCIEKRLKRKLTLEDFNWSIPLNGPMERRSERLASRMGYGE